MDSPTIAYYVNDIDDAETLAERVAWFDKDVKASLDERIATAEKNLADAIAAVEVGSDVYYVSAWGRDPVEVAVSIAADYNTDELQIFKVYGTWYVQNYGDLTVDGYTVYFTVDGAIYEVVYDNAHSMRLPVRLLVRKFPERSSVSVLQMLLSSTTALRM